MHLAIHHEIKPTLYYATHAIPTKDLPIDTHSHESKMTYPCASPKRGGLDLHTPNNTHAYRDQNVPPTIHTNLTTDSLTAAVSDTNTIELMLGLTTQLIRTRKA